MSYSNTWAVEYSKAVCEKYPEQCVCSRERQSATFSVCWSGVDCFDGFENTATCWSLCFAQLIISVLLIIYGKCVQSGWSISRLIISSVASTDKPDVFLSHIRKEANFIRGDLDDKLEFPLKYPPEYKPHTDTTWSMMQPCLRSDELSGLAWVSLGISVLCGSLGTFLWLARSFSDMNDHLIRTGIQNSSPEELLACGLAFSSLKEYLDSTSSVLDTVYDDYKFFPMFMLIGYLSFLVGKWRDWMVNAHTVQARIHDLCLLCGSSVQAPVDIATRKSFFRLYRYLNMVHALTYKTVMPNLKTLQLDPDYVRLGLLTQAEASSLQQIPAKMREKLLTWIGAEMTNLLRNNVLHEGMAPTFAEKLCGLRGICARHMDLFVRDYSNTYISALMMAFNHLMALIVIGFPIKLLMYMGPGSPCIQPWTIICTFLVMYAFLSCLVLEKLLRNPFESFLTFGKPGHELIRADSLIASSELFMFTVLRAQFDSAITGDFVQEERSTKAPCVAEL